MRLVIYGTLRQGEKLSCILPTEGRREVMEISGLCIYVVGDCPGAKLGSQSHKAIVEIWELNLSKAAEKILLFIQSVMI